MAEPEDFYRDFLPCFIDAQRAFHDGDPEPNLALWSSEDPVTLFAARGLLESVTEPVTALAPAVAAGALAPEVAAGALAPPEAAGVLHAAMIAGTDTRPAAPAMPLRTVRLETASRMGSAMAYSSCDAARQNPTGSAGLSLPEPVVSRFWSV